MGRDKAGEIWLRSFFIKKIFLKRSNENMKKWLGKCCRSRQSQNFNVKNLNFANIFFSFEA